MKKNQNMIKILTNRSLKANKKRNFFMVSAIFLTTFMITAVLSVAVSMIESFHLQSVRLQGSQSHAVFGFPTEYQLDVLSSLDYVESFGTGKYIGFVENELLNSDAQLSLIHVDHNFFDDILTPAIDNITGTLPVEENEIMASRWALEMMGIEDPQIGMSIPLTFILTDNETSHSQDFILSGFYTSFDHLFRQEGYFIATADLAQKFGATLQENGSVNILFQDSRQVHNYAGRLLGDLGLTSEELIIHPVFDVDYADHLITIVSVIFIIMFLMLTGYLLIYNVLYISITRDIRFYGLLKTLGVTPKQTRQMIMAQALKLCLIGIPIGIGLGFLISFVIAPLIVGGIETGVVITFSPIIYIGAIIFAFLTTLIGAVSPAKRMSEMSSIEAVKYVGDINAKEYSGTQTKGKLHKMAFRNVFRDRKRGIVVFLSLSFSVIIFIFITLIVSSLNLDQYVANVESDFIFENEGFLRHVDTTSNPFNESFLAQIEELPGVESIYTTRQQHIHIDYQTALDDHIEMDIAWHRERDFNYTPKEQLIQEGLHGIIFGIDSEILEELNPDIDMVAFDRGDLAVIVTDQPELYSEIINIEGYLELTGESFNIPIGGFVPVNSDRWHTPYSHAAPLLIVSNAVLNQLTEDSYVTHVYVNTLEERYDEYLLESFQEMLNNQSAIAMRSRIEERQVFENAKNILFALGLGVSSLLGGIGFMNFINTMSMGVLMRKREFATLESIGMTQKQLRSILIFEGIWYGLITLLFVLTIGNGIAIGLYQLVAIPWGEFMNFTYPIVPTFIVILIVLVICASVPEMFYRSLNKQSIIERLREAE